MDTDPNENDPPDPPARPAATADANEPERSAESAAGPDVAEPERSAAEARPGARTRGHLVKWLLRGRRPTWGDLARLLGSWALGAVVLGAIIAVHTGISVADGAWSVVLATLVISAVGVVLRPVLTALAVALSWFGVFVIGLLAQAVVTYVGLLLTPGVTINGFGDAVAAAWLYALFATVFSWLLVINQDDDFVGYVMRHATRGRRGNPVRDGLTGVVFVQLDGLPRPVLEWALRAGNLPTLSRWVRSGGHTVRGWTARIPSTTPVSQAGLLHGTTEGMPAFRWYEKDQGRMLVANRPADAAVIQRRLSDGRGLLADDGVSVSNLFSGDAPVRLLTMSGAESGGSLGPSASYASFFTHPFGFARALFLTVGEMVKELWQGREQRKRGIEPRIRRGGWYVPLRGITNVMLRDLNVALVVEQMMRGARSIYVDFVDYDEIAHHAGPVRAESMRSLEGLDRVLGVLERVATQAPRPYAFVILSDHGQTQGATFLQRVGSPLEAVVRKLMDGTRDAEPPPDGDGHAETASIEEWGPVNTFLTQLVQQDSVSAGIARRVLGRRAETGFGPANPPPGEEEGGEQGKPDDEVIVCASGCLGLAYFPRHPGRLSHERIEGLWPGLVARLAAHPGIGVVVVVSDAFGPLAVGRDGVRHLTTGRVDGADPLRGLPAQAAADFARLAALDHAPDLYLHGVYDPDSGEVAAFEEQVGSHGGVGGWQNEAVLVHPSDWPLDDPDLFGAETVHRQLVTWLEDLGHRKNLPAPPDPNGPISDVRAGADFHAVTAAPAGPDPHAVSDARPGTDDRAVSGARPGTDDRAVSDARAGTDDQAVSEVRRPEA